MLGTINSIQALLDFEESKFIEIQASARAYARRGIYARVDLGAGIVLEDSHVISLRPIPTNGISAAEIESVIGKKTTRKISAGSAIRLDDFH